MTVPVSFTVPKACDVSQEFPGKVLRWCNMITRYAHKHDLDPDLVAAVILVESNGRPGAKSRSGAIGLMQVMPRDGKAAKFMCPNGPCFAKRPPISKLLDPEFNISYGTWMLAGLIRRNGLRDGLRAYGPKDYGYKYADLVIKTVGEYGRKGN